MANQTPQKSTDPQKPVDSKAEQKPLDPKPTDAELAQAGAIDDVVDPEVAKVLKEKRAALAKLKAEREIQLIDAEMERIARGDVSPAMVAMKKKQEAIRAATATEMQPHEGSQRKVGLYLIRTKSFLDKEGKGGPHVLHPENTIIKHAYDLLPDPEWLPVEPAAVAPERSYVAKS